jgi:hypothetical protein
VPSIGQLWQPYQQVLKPWFFAIDAFSRYSTRISRSFFTNFQRSAFGHWGITWGAPFPPMAEPILAEERGNTPCGAHRSGFSVRLSGV